MRRRPISPLPRRVGEEAPGRHPARVGQPHLAAELGQQVEQRGRRCGPRRGRRPPARGRSSRRRPGVEPVELRRSRPPRRCASAFVATSSQRLRATSPIAVTRPPAAAAANDGSASPQPSSSTRAPRSDRTTTASASARPLAQSSAQYGHELVAVERPRRRAAPPRRAGGSRRSRGRGSARLPRPVGFVHKRDTGTTDTRPRLDCRPFMPRAATAADHHASTTSSSSPASPVPASRRRWPRSRTPATSASTTCRRR